MGFSVFGLSEPIVQGVYASGYSIPTNIQSQAIPLVLDGRDIIGCAPTGTGKTAAFVLPILDRLARIKHEDRKGRFPRCLVLTPTRELAQQIEDSVHTYGMYTNIRAISVYGGVSIVNQLHELKRGVDIVIATPGRLLDHIDRHSINLSRVEMLVLDEADRMYDMGFIHDVRAIISLTPAQRQTLLFSATMSREIRALVAAIQRDPQLIEVGEPFTPVETVEQHFYSVGQQNKLDLLVHIIQRENVESMLCFSRTKHGADRIARRLVQRGITCDAIHADRSMGQRKDALEGFKRREYRVMVATDLAARGIDVVGITHVVNFDTPAFAEDYIHRIGRTGRAERTGTAITFVSSDEEKYLKRIQYLTGKKFQVRPYPGFEFPEHKPVTATTQGPQRRMHQQRKMMMSARGGFGGRR
jgi:ATP-dependent RNA helicase RhlE